MNDSSTSETGTDASAHANTSSPAGARVAQSISVLIASRNRPAEVQKCIESVLRQSTQPLEIVVLDDGSDVPLKDGISLDPAAVSIKWLRNEAPTGVSGARNTLVENADGEILVFIDDDAWLIGDDALDKVYRIFESDAEVGIVAFKIHLHSPESGELQVPFTKRSLAKDPSISTRPQKASYFVGAGHAIKKSVFERCGPYPVEFVYGHEELDLSYRAINHGFTTLYEPEIAVVHAPATSQVAGAGKRRFESYYVTRNRIWLAHRNLPWRYAVPYSANWSLYYLAKSLRHGGIISWVAAIKDGLFGLDRSKRQPLSKSAVGYLSRHHGRLWR